MVGFSEDHIKNCCVPYETDMIKYYAWEIGQLSRLLEKEKDAKQWQWWKFFLTYAEIEMENHSGNLKEHREQLNSFRMSRKNVS